MQIAEALHVSHILHNWNVHFFTYRRGTVANRGSGVGIFPGLHPTFFVAGQRKMSTSTRVVGWTSLATSTACSVRLS